MNVVNLSTISPSCIFTAPIYNLKQLNNIFIELTAKNCNQRCKNCYIDLPSSTKIIKDFISIDRIKEAIEDTLNENLYCIYLTGAEPMLHPDFNTILRLCLKRCNVCICTNGSFLNEKKVRFLNKVESELKNSIICSVRGKVPLAIYDAVFCAKRIVNLIVSLRNSILLDISLYLSV